MTSTESSEACAVSADGGRECTRRVAKRVGRLGCFWLRSPGPSACKRSADLETDFFFTSTYVRLRHGHFRHINSRKVAIAGIGPVGRGQLVV